MNISQDVSAFTTLARDIAARQDNRRQAQTDSSLVNKDAAATSASARPVQPAAKAAQGARTEQDAQQRGAASDFRQREVPIGQRPKFIPKGQAVNILV